MEVVKQFIENNEWVTWVFSGVGVTVLLIIFGFMKSQITVKFQTIGSNICIVSSETCWGKTWHLICNVEISRDKYQTYDIQSVLARCPGTNKIMLWIDRLLFNKVLREDQRVLSDIDFIGENLDNEHPIQKFKDLDSAMPSFDFPNDGP